MMSAFRSITRWSSFDAPPYTHTVFSPTREPSLASCSPVCIANSRVGDTTTRSREDSFVYEGPQKAFGFF